MLSCTLDLAASLATGSRPSIGLMAPLPLVLQPRSSEPAKGRSCMQVKQLQAEVEAQRDLINAQAAGVAARALQVKEAQHALTGAQHTTQRAQQECGDVRQVR